MRRSDHSVLSTQTACFPKFRSTFLFQTSTQGRQRNRGVPEQSLCPHKNWQSSGSELLLGSLPHGGSAAPFKILQGALSLRSFLVLGIPHAPFGVIVMKEVPQTESLYFQTILQYPAEGKRERFLFSWQFLNLQGKYSFRII